MIEIKEVATKSQLTEFICFPDKLYKGNPYRVPPLHYVEKGSLDKKRNPAFDYCEAKYWLAYKNGKIVGRIAGIINSSANKLLNENSVRFGWIDFTDDVEVSSALLKTVEEWAASMGFDHVHGPLGFTDMDLEGMLVSGFNEIGTQAVLYNYEYYPQHLLNLGYEKEVDWIQFEIRVPDSVPERITRIADIVKQKYNLRVLQATKSKELLPYAKKMFQTMNESFIELYGYVPLTDKQMDYYTDMYFSLINPKFVCFILDEDDDVAGFGLALYSLSKALIKAKGSLFPFGFIHLMKAMRKNDTVDILLQGVKKKYINKGLPAIFFAELMQAFIDNGVKTAVSSHALEKNIAAYLMFDDFMSRNHLRRRCFGKKLNGIENGIKV
ncbi:MAG TPA: hypothetical protein VK172_02740 [Lentimicrobium sp.]|nr:hypothetical protein [Lentimicrobium sp.]